MTLCRVTSFVETSWYPVPTEALLCQDTAELILSQFVHSCRINLTPLPLPGSGQATKGSQRRVHPFPSWLTPLPLAAYLSWMRGSLIFILQLGRNSLKNSSRNDRRHTARCRLKYLLPNIGRNLVIDRQWKYFEGSFLQHTFHKLSSIRLKKIMF